MTRSKGVTGFAIFLLLAGAFMIIGNAVTLLTGPQSARRLEQQAEALEARREATLGQAQEQSAKAEDVARAREQFDKLVAAMHTMASTARQAYQRPVVMAISGLGALLGVAAFAAGLGLLRLREWARRLILWQAALSIPIGLWSMAVLAPFYHHMRQSMLELVSTLGVPAQTQDMVQTGQIIGQWLGILLLVGWNGFVIWWFRRPSVKAQFVDG